MRETPRSRQVANGSEPARTQPRHGRALAHTTGASGSGTPHRSDGRPPHTPRGARCAERDGLPGTSPLVPRRPSFLRSLLRRPPSRQTRPRPHSAAATWAVIALCALLFALVTWQVGTHGPLWSLDERIGRALGRPKSPSAVAELCADLGNLPVAAGVLAAATGYAVWRARRAGARARSAGTWLPPLSAWLAMGAAAALVVPLKHALARPGPSGPLIGYSGYYPSGHTATAVVAYGTAAVLVAGAAARRQHARSGPPPARREAQREAHREARQQARPQARHQAPRRSRWLPATAAVLLNLAVAAGLVRRGYHWPLDVLGSWLLCVPLVLAVARVSVAVSRRPGRAGPRPRASTAPGAPGR
ncbi:phosphatase PAP2 family protein [Streptomyces sp. URMC 123]|uniref:phosphatase PAP2 family protein n=1 Tax=Streptomyces sp. URMC 123 TaxID=3423403 RepID=UPI003F1CAE8D